MVGRGFLEEGGMCPAATYQECSILRMGGGSLRVMMFFMTPHLIDRIGLSKIGQKSQTEAVAKKDFQKITTSAKEYLVPAIPSVIVDVDINKDVITIRPLKGIFDDED